MPGRGRGCGWWLSTSRRSLRAGGWCRCRRERVPPLAAGRSTLRLGLGAVELELDLLPAGGEFLQLGLRLAELFEQLIAALLVRVHARIGEQIAPLFLLLLQLADLRLQLGHFALQLLL